jgi:4-amino-4-deoxy-L-arabinose transferase-like glycosyltransferase
VHDEKQKFNRDALVEMFAGFRAYVLLAAALVILYIVLAPLVTLGGNSMAIATAMKPYDGDANVMLAMALVLIALSGVALLLLSTHRMTAGRLMALLLAAGFVLRFGYMLYTPFYIRGHDISTYSGHGHLAYVYRLFIGKGLPDRSVSQFYHPPFAHIADAAVAGFFSLLYRFQNVDTYMEAARLVPCFASCGLLIVCVRLLRELGFSRRAKTVAVAVLAFHPTFILLSASINNDMLMLFFFMAAFLYSVRWYRESSYRNTILLGVAIGCAMSTKFSGSLVAVYTAMIFIIVLARRLKEGKSWDLIPKFAVFAVICFPLGLWYQYRNLKLFGQKLGYVPHASAKSALYVGDKTTAERFLSFSLPDILKTIYCQPFNDFRIWEYTVKCALFGEFTFSSRHNLLAGVMIVSSLLLILLSLGAMIWFLLFDRRYSRLAVLSFSFLWVLLMVSFVCFNLRYPFGCSMDFRYIVPTVVTGAAFLGFLSDKLAGSRAKNGLFAAFCALLAVFCVTSACFYVI